MSSVSNDVVRRKRIDDALARQNFAAPSPPRPPVNPATYSFVSSPPLPWIHEEEAKKIARSKRGSGLAYRPLTPPLLLKRPSAFSPLRRKERLRLRCAPV